MYILRHLVLMYILGHFLYKVLNIPIEDELKNLYDKYKGYKNKSKHIAGDLPV